MIYLSIPRTWESSTVIPVPKKPNVKQTNDFRPQDLTSILAKCMERIVVCNQLVASVADRMDPLQLAYKARRGGEDACLSGMLYVTVIYRNVDHSLAVIY